MNEPCVVTVALKHAPRLDIKACDNSIQIWFQKDGLQHILYLMPDEAKMLAANLRVAAELAGPKCR